MKKIILTFTAIFAVLIFVNTQTVNAQANTVCVYTCSSMASYHTTDKIVMWYSYENGNSQGFPTITVQCNQQNNFPKQENESGTLHMYVVNEISSGWYIIEGQQNIPFTGDEQINVVFNWEKKHVLPPLPEPGVLLPCSMP